MAHTYNCPNCSRKMVVSDKLFAERISGKNVTVRCKRCKTPLEIEEEHLVDDEHRLEPEHLVEDEHRLELASPSLT